MSKEKALVAEVLAKRVKDGQIIGFGSGSTTEVAIEAIAKRVAAEKLDISAVATSVRTAIKASEAGVRVLSSHIDAELDWAFDGADEVDEQFRLIKGGGACMLSEKINARKAKEFIILVSDSKLVSRLGENFPVPVEVIPEARAIVQKALIDLGATEVVLRESKGKYGPVITEHGNLVLDARFDSIATSLEGEINMLTGVVESGLFTGFNPEVLVARGGKVFSRRLKNGKIEEAPVV